MEVGQTMENERLTSEHWRNDDPWELCGLGDGCERRCVNEGKWCKVAIKLRRLASYEDIGTAEEFAKLKSEDIALTKQWEEFKEHAYAVNKRFLESYSKERGQHNDTTRD